MAASAHTASRTRPAAILLLCLLTILATILPCFHALASRPAHPAAMATMAMPTSQTGPHACCPPNPSLTAPALCCQTHPQPATSVLPTSQALVPPATPFRPAALTLIPTPTLFLAASITIPKPPLLTILRI